MENKDLSFLNMVGQAALSIRETVYNSFELAERCILEGVEGDFVECGVFAGTQCAAMAYAAIKHKSNKKVHLFDSFEGIPMAGPNDTVQPGFHAGHPFQDKAAAGEGTGELESSGISICSLENVQTFMKNWGIPSSMLVYHKGWFENVLPKTEIGNIAILRLDGDLYNSTKVCLEYLYPKLKGFLIVDDYPLVGSRKACTEYFASHNINAIPKYVLDNAGNPAFFDMR